MTNRRRRRLARALLAAAAIVHAAGAAAESNADAAGRAATSYVKLHPDFLVNLESSDGMHFLHATIEVGSKDEEYLQRAWYHVAAIRHELLIFLSEQHYEGIGSPATRKRLQAEALTIVNAVMRRETGRADIESLYFTHYMVE